MRYSQEQIQTALKLLDKTGSPSVVIRTLGYPSWRTLYIWKDTHKHLHRKRRKWYKASYELKIETIHRCFDSYKPVKLVAEEIGYSVASIYMWRRQYQEKGISALMKKKTTISKQNEELSPDDIATIKAQMLDMQMEIDILKETIKVLKKDPGIDQAALKNREKAVIVDALKNRYSLPKLLKRISLSKSSYYYRKSILQRENKYLKLRGKIIQLFHDNRNTYGYRKIWLDLKAEGITVSEKVIRRIMKQEGLVVVVKKRAKYNSYKGEITPAVPNHVNRQFHAEKKNQLWLTDITEFKLDAGKVYLSPMIDCLDGMPFTWTIGTSPNANLTNTMLKQAIATLEPGEKPIVHSDRGCHYRWPEWIHIMEDAGLTRSMSKKGCSPDNSACEGFFGHLKNEMFYGRSWKGVSIKEFIAILDDYMHWYCEKRRKLTLGGLSPLDYRRSIGVSV